MKKYVITHSENNHIYINNTMDSNKCRKIKTKQKCINLIKPLPKSYKVTLVGFKDTLNI